jgi:type II secretory pathway component GspD/PulD (secretin)
MRNLKRTLILISIGAFIQLNAHAEDAQMKFNYSNADVSQVIEDYSKASGQRFIYDPQVRGKVTVINPQKISLDEAFAQLSTSLAVNGIGISKQGDVMVIQQARSIQRNFIDIGTTLPPLRPERMFTWVVELKHASAQKINNELRILTSKDGELVALTTTNQILVTDWVSNLHRIEKIIEAVDRPARDVKTADIHIPPVRMSDNGAPEPIM